MALRAEHPQAFRRASVVATAVLLGVMVVVGEAAVGLVVVSTVGVLALLLLIRLWFSDDPELRRRIFGWTIGAFAAHLLLGLIVTASSSATWYLGGDAIGYHGYAAAVVRFGRHSVGAAPTSGKAGFYNVLIGLYQVFGSHPAAGLAFNAVLAAALVPLVGDLTRRLFGPSAARRVPPLVVLLPSWFLFTSMLLKEASVLFLVAVAANCATRILERLSPLPLVTLTAAFALLFSFRGQVAIVFASSLVVGLIIAGPLLVRSMAVGFTSMVLFAMLVLALGVGYSGFQASLRAANLKDARGLQVGLASGARSGYSSNLDTSTVRGAISYLPQGLATVAVGPLPWQLNGLRQLPALVDVAVWWTLLPSLWRGLRAARKLVGRRIVTFVLPAFAVASALALSIGNYGTLVRERTQFILLLVPFVALGLAMRADTDSEAAPAPASPGEEPGSRETAPSAGRPPGTVRVPAGR